MYNIYFQCKPLLTYEISTEIAPLVSARIPHNSATIHTSLSATFTEPVSHIFVPKDRADMPKLT